MQPVFLFDHRSRFLFSYHHYKSSEIHLCSNKIHVSSLSLPICIHISYLIPQNRLISPQILIFMQMTKMPMFICGIFSYPLQKIVQSFFFRMIWVKNTHGVFRRCMCNNIVHVIFLFSLNYELLPSFPHLLAFPDTTSYSPIVATLYQLSMRRRM